MYSIVILLLSGRFLIAILYVLGMTAPQAAGVIHSDFEKGFIRAETVSIGSRSLNLLLKIDLIVAF